MLQVRYLCIDAGTGKAIITETGNAVLGNLQHNDMAISEEVRRDYGSTKSQMGDNMTWYVTEPAWKNSDAEQEQEIRDGMDTHAFSKHYNQREIAFLSTQLDLLIFLLKLMFT